MIGILVLLIIATKLSPNLNAAVQTLAFTRCVWVLFFLALASLLFTERTKLKICLVFLSTAMMLMSTVVHIEMYSILSALVLTMTIFVGLIVFGYNHDLPIHIQKALIPSLFMLLILGCINAFITKSDRWQFMLAILGSVLFSMFVVYDVKRFTKDCKKDCCAKGVLSLWLDFINLFNNILYVTNQ